MNELSQAWAYYRTNPQHFFNDILNIHFLWRGQREALEAINTHKRVAIPSGHSTGKSALAGGITSWWLTTRPKSRVIVTAPTFRQLYTVYWAELSKWYNQSKLKDLDLFRLTNTSFAINDEELKREWYAMPISPKNPDALQGQHGDKNELVKKIMEEMGIHEVTDDKTIEDITRILKGEKGSDKSDKEKLLVIIDEASGVQQEILEVLEGTDYDKLVMFGNMTKASGMFYDAVYRHTDLYKVVRLNSEESPFMSQEQVEFIAEKYGIDSNVYRVRIKGEAPTQDDDTIIPVNLLRENVKEYKKGSTPNKNAVIEIGNDVARFGDDKTTIYAKDGEKILEAIVGSKQDTMWTANTLFRLCLKYKNHKKKVKIDETGVGSGVVDRLKELRPANTTIIGVNNGSDAQNKKEYADKITEMYFQYLDKLKNGEAYVMDDEELIVELSTRKYEFDSKGRLKVVSKDKYKKEFGKSPDKADGWLLLWYSIEKGKAKVSNLSKFAK